MYETTSGVIRFSRIQNSIESVYLWIVAVADAIVCEEECNLSSCPVTYSDTMEMNRAPSGQSLGVNATEEHSGPWRDGDGYQTGFTRSV